MSNSDNSSTNNQRQPYSIYTQMYVQCHFQSNFNASLEQRWIFIFNGLSQSQLSVRLLLLLLIKLWSRWVEKYTATWRTRVMDTYCQLWFTICKWQLAPSAQAHSHTHTPSLSYTYTPTHFLLFKIDLESWAHNGPAQHFIYTQSARR